MVSNKKSAAVLFPNFLWITCFFLSGRLQDFIFSLFFGSLQCNMPMCVLMSLCYCCSFYDLYLFCLVFSEFFWISGLVSVFNFEKKMQCSCYFFKSLFCSVFYLLFFWNFYYMCFRLSNIVPQLLHIRLQVFVGEEGDTNFSLCISLGNFYSFISSSLILSCVKFIKGSPYLSYYLFYI